jgi:hypothetical protein
MLAPPADERNMTAASSTGTALRRRVDEARATRAWTTILDTDDHRRNR